MKKADFKKSSLTSGAQAADLKLIMLQSMGMQINASLQHKESDTQCADSTQHFSKTNEGLLRKLQGHVAESCQMNPCYDFIMQLSKRIYILENKSNEVDMIEDNLEEKPDIQQQLSKINKITSEFDQFKLDVNLLSAKISSFEDRLTSLESNEDFLFQQAEIILHNASVIEEYVKINTNKQEALDTSFNNVTGEIELLKLSATLQRSMVKQISSFKISMNNELENLHVSIDSLARNCEYQHPTSPINNCLNSQLFGSTANSCIDQVHTGLEVQHLVQDLPQTQIESSLNMNNKKPVANKTFPCVIHGQSHDLNKCPEFYSCTTKKRVEGRKCTNFRHCTICLQSNDLCKYKKCANIKNIPSILICKDCKSMSKTQKKACYSVFFCLNRNHLKPSSNQLIKALEHYIPGFKASRLNKPINLSGSSFISTYSKTRMNSVAKSRPVNPDEKIPAFNSSTGEIEYPEDSKLVHEINEDSLAVMQTLCINGKTVLTIYDRGANQHIVKGSLAEETKMKVVNSKASTIGIVSGSKISTEYGTYQMFLGPTEDGKYYEITASGMNDITNVYQRYDLAEINREAVTFTEIDSSSVMPPYVGGEEVKLLIGLKNSELEPVCIMNLPSGIGLYKSVFKDIYGSVYCYGGPHKIFTELNKRFHGKSSCVTAYLSEIVNQYRYSPYLITLLNHQDDLSETVNHDESEIVNLENHLDVRTSDGTSITIEKSVINADTKILKHEPVMSSHVEGDGQSFLIFFQAGKGSQAFIDILSRSFKTRLKKLLILCDNFF